MTSLQTDVILELSHVSHWFGKTEASGRILHEVNIVIERGSFVGLVGPSGCGKSTLLNAVLGTHPAKQGEIRIFRREDPLVGTQIVKPGKDRGVVYQKYRLPENLRAIDAVVLGKMWAYPLAKRMVNPRTWWRYKTQVYEEARALLERMHLGHATDRFPYELSGGMQQRVAIAQAMIMKPEIILLDEPFGALDEAIREELRAMLRELYQENIDAKACGEKPPHTLIIVTHEINEAIDVGDRVIALSRFWNYEAAGFTQCPGATVVYDDMAIDNHQPNFCTSMVPDYESFAAQKQLVLRTAFDKNVRDPRDTYVLYWKRKLGQACPPIAASVT